MNQKIKLGFFLAVTTASCLSAEKKTPTFSNEAIQKVVESVQSDDFTSNFEMDELFKLTSKGEDVSGNSYFDMQLPLQKGHNYLLCLFSETNLSDSCAFTVNDEFQLSPLRDNHLPQLSVEASTGEEFILFLVDLDEKACFNVSIAPFSQLYRFGNRSTTCKFRYDIDLLVYWVVFDSFQPFEEVRMESLFGSEKREEFFRMDEFGRAACPCITDDSTVRFFTSQGNFEWNWDGKGREKKKAIIHLK